MTIIGTVTATNRITGRVVERSIPAFAISDDAHIFEVEDTAADYTFPEGHFAIVSVWVTREPVA